MTSSVPSTGIQFFSHDAFVGGQSYTDSITVATADGTTLGLSDIPQGDGMELEVIIDQQPPITLKRRLWGKANPYCAGLAMPFAKRVGKRAGARSIALGGLGLMAGWAFLALQAYRAGLGSAKP